MSPDGATVHQLVCSPVHNYVPLFVKPVFKLGWTRPAAAVIRWWVRRTGVPSPRFRSVELLADLMLGDRAAKRGHPAGHLARDDLVRQAYLGEHLTA